MNIHLLTWEDGTCLAFESFVSTREIECEDSEAKEWIERLSIPQLPPEETYHFNKLTDDERDTGVAKEWLLTEKQSALFLLRFK